MHDHAPYPKRRPTETLLYAVVRENLETFLGAARCSYERPLPHYVESEFRAYLKCGVFRYGFLRCHCDACGEDLLVAFSCKGRGLCPSCGTRRMSNTAAHLVDRVLPDVPLRQYVLSLPFELRRLAAFDPKVLTALARMFVGQLFTLHRRRARGRGVEGVACGAITFVQRFGGSLNLNVHFHVVVFDGVFTRGTFGPTFHPALPPTRKELEALVQSTATCSVRWLARHGYLGREDAAPETTALDACARIALHRGELVVVPGRSPVDEEPRDRPRFAAAHAGFNVHAGVHIRAGDDEGREKLCRYGARPGLALDRLRRLPDGRIAYRVKYSRGNRPTERVMTPLELLARLAALIPPPRYPLVRYSGVVAPNSPWRALVTPKPRAAPACAATSATASRGALDAKVGWAHANAREKPPPHPTSPRASALHGEPVRSASSARLLDDNADAILLAPNVLSVRHWSRIGEGLLLATSARIDWAKLLKRSFDVDALVCPRCHGRLRVLAAITEEATATTILASLRLPLAAPPLARARDPTGDDVEYASSDD